MPSFLEINRTIIPFGYTCRYQADLDLKSDSLLRLAAQIIDNLLPKEVFSGEPLLDMRGRESHELLIENTPEQLKPLLPEELFFLSGEILAPLEDFENRTPEEPRPHPFRISINTSFCEFKGTKHITHNVVFSRAWPLPQAFPLKEFIGLLAPTINCLRFGADFFQGRFLSRWLGYNPIVTDTLAIEAYGGKCIILISSESLRRRNDLPLQYGAWFKKTAEVLQNGCGFDLEKDYLRSLHSTDSAQGHPH